MRWRESTHEPLPCHDFDNDGLPEPAGARLWQWAASLPARTFFTPSSARHLPQGTSLLPSSPLNSDEEDEFGSARQPPGDHCLSAWVMPSVLAATGLALAIVAWGGGSSPSVREPLHVAGRGSLFSVLQDCHTPAKDMDFEGDLQGISTTQERSSRDCSMKCMSIPECSVWSWGSMRNVKGLSDACMLKHAPSTVGLTKVQRHGIASGVRSGSACPPESSPTRSFSGSGLLLKNRHGLCIDAPEPAADGAKVHMWACSGVPNQNWDYDETTGRIKNSFGICLSVAHWAKDYANVHMQACKDGDWNQQWSYEPVSGIIKTWRGICLDAGERFRNGGEIYMRACDTKNLNLQWRIGSAADMEQDGPIPPPGGDPSLYCFSLMMPRSYEQDLLATQFKHKASIFACDRYDVFSNEEIEVYPGLTSQSVDSNLECAKGGEFGTALNLDIFIEVWKRVISVGAYAEVAWTVKTDPDAVFLSSRLRNYLMDHAEDPGNQGVYLNNCKYGLHGPIEIFSRRAVELWGGGWQQCKQHFQEKCKGDCFWGEDIFVDQCLSKVLGVRRDNDFRLLVEDHCDPPPGWQSCEDQTYVTYHPFKTSIDYMACLGRAGEVTAPVAALPPPVPPPTLAAAAAPDVPATTPPVPVVQEVLAAEIVDVPAVAPEVPAAPAASAAAAAAAPPEAPEALATPAGPAVGASEDQPCHTAVKGEDCYTALVWAREYGISMHPNWYAGVTNSSSLLDFQRLLYVRPEVKCPPPC